jgi:hypothetical protein
MAEKSSPRLRYDDFVNAVHPDPAKAEPTILVSGYLGRSSEEGNARIYPDASLGNWYEVPESDVVHSAPIADSPLGGSNIWLKASAKLTPSIPIPPQAEGVKEGGGAKQEAVGADTGVFNPMATIHPTIWTQFCPTGVGCIATVPCLPPSVGCPPGAAQAVLGPTGTQGCTQPGHCVGQTGWHTCGCPIGPTGYQGCGPQAYGAEQSTAATLCTRVSPCVGHTGWHTCGCPIGPTGYQGCGPQAYGAEQSTAATLCTRVSPCVGHTGTQNCTHAGCGVVGPTGTQGCTQPGHCVGQTGWHTCACPIGVTGWLGCQDDAARQITISPTASTRCFICPPITADPTLATRCFICPPIDAGGFAAQAVAAPYTSNPGCPNTSTCTPQTLDPGCPNTSTCTPQGGWPPTTLCAVGPTGTQGCTQPGHCVGQTGWQGCGQGYAAEQSTAATLCTRYGCATNPVITLLTVSGCTHLPGCHIGYTGTQGCTHTPACAIGHTGTQGCTHMPGCNIGYTGWQGCGQQNTAATVCTQVGCRQAGGDPVITLLTVPNCPHPSWVDACQTRLCVTISGPCLPYTLGGCYQG